MKIIQDKKDKNKFKVESESSKGKFYEVDLQEKKCTCPK